MSQPLPVEASVKLSVVSSGDEPTCLEARSGRRIELEQREGEDETVRVIAPDGRLELAIRMTPRGPVLELAAIELRMQAKGTLALEGEDVQVRARQGLELQVGGDLTERVGGDRLARTSGVAYHEADRIGLATREGDLELAAHADVRIDGEHVRINCK